MTLTRRFWLAALISRVLEITWERANNVGISAARYFQSTSCIKHWDHASSRLWTPRMHRTHRHEAVRSPLTASNSAFCRPADQLTQSDGGHSRKCLVHASVARVHDNVLIARRHSRKCDCNCYSVWL